MHQNKNTKKKRKFRFLLDSAFAKSDQFPKLIKKAKLLHVVHDLGLSKQAADKDIYQKAIEENCFVLTINFKHFRKFVIGSKSGVIGIDSQLSNDEIDSVVVEFISGKSPDDYLGKAIKI